MRQTIHKLFWVWDFDKEEKWLNEMAAKGLSLVSVGFCKYEFSDRVPGDILPTLVWNACEQFENLNIVNLFDNLSKK